MDESDDWARRRVLRFLAEHSGRLPASIQHEESLSVFEIDSLEDVEFVMELEEELGIEIPEPKTSFQTVGDLVAFVRQAIQ